MTTPWTAEELRHARTCSISRLCAGDAPSEIAEVMQVSVRSVQRWVRAWALWGDAALEPKARTGRPPKLTDEQGAQVLEWIGQSPCDFGFSTERWTAPRVTPLIERQFGLRMNHRYLNHWLRRRDITPQIPQRRAQERDEALIRFWVACQWPRIKKRRGNWVRRLLLRTKADSCCCR